MEYHLTKYENVKSMACEAHLYRISSLFRTPVYDYFFSIVNIFLETMETEILPAKIFHLASFTRLTRLVFSDKFRKKKISSIYILCIFEFLKKEIPNFFFVLKFFKRVDMKLIALVINFFLSHQSPSSNFH